MATARRAIWQLAARSWQLQRGLQSLSPRVLTVTSALRLCSTRDGPCLPLFILNDSQNMHSISLHLPQRRASLLSFCIGSLCLSLALLPRHSSHSSLLCPSPVASE